MVKLWGQQILLTTLESFYRQSQICEKRSADM